MSNRKLGPAKEAFMKPFLSEDFILQTETAKVLYQDFAKSMPIYDYHCHLPVQEIAENKKFKNLTQIWLYGDHYKWRAMRACGIDERLITGEAEDDEKFAAWAATVPKTLRNPIYHWTHMELKNPFGISGILLNPDTSEEIYARCNEMLQEDGFSTRGIMKQMNVRVVCTTDDPADDLSYHQKIRSDQSFGIRIVPTLRPDKALAIENPEAFNAWTDRLEAASDMAINDYPAFLEALRKRHDAFHEAGCRSSDHGLERPYSDDFSPREIDGIFDTIRSGKTTSAENISKFKSAVLLEIAAMHAEKGWVQQFHFGAIRSTNTRFFKRLGPDTGFDSIGDFELAKPLAKFFDLLDRDGRLTKTILYNVNPRDNDLMASMTGNFQDGSVPGKMQFGTAWWFADQKDGMEKQINALSNIGLLSQFVGMTTDSRSFLSYPRHDYFRRILCNLLGNEVENGELPNEIALIGNMVKDICYHNAMRYFSIPGVE